MHGAWAAAPAALLSMAPMALGMSYAALLRAAGDTRTVMTASVISDYTLLLPLGWLLGVHAGLGLPGLLHGLDRLRHPVLRTTPAALQTPLRGPPPAKGGTVRGRAGFPQSRAAELSLGICPGSRPSPPRATHSIRSGWTRPSPNLRHLASTRGGAVSQRSPRMGLRRTAGRSAVALVHHCELGSGAVAGHARLQTAAHEPGLVTFTIIRRDVPGSGFHRRAESRTADRRTDRCRAPHGRSSPRPPQCRTFTAQWDE
ncbi:hypothetical protein [Streptomyces platensis]|uniref:hypothetical protein n=1 Tax=Streptomyces platensis TaxID=58346 RepID=UPI00386926FE